jgi:hypothetical protein
MLTILWNLDTEYPGTITGSKNNDIGWLCSTNRSDKNYQQIYSKNLEGRNY